MEALANGARSRDARDPLRPASRIASSIPCHVGPSDSLRIGVNRPCTALASVPSDGLAAAFDLGALIGIPYG